MQITYRRGRRRPRRFAGAPPPPPPEGAAYGPNFRVTEFSVHNPTASPMPAGTHVFFGLPMIKGKTPASTHILEVRRVSDGLRIVTDDAMRGTYADGTLRWARIGFALPDAIAAGGSADFRLWARQASPAGAAVAWGDWNGLRVEATIGGTTWTAALGDPEVSRTYLDGPLTQGRRIVAAFKNGGTPHAELRAVFYAERLSTGDTRFDVAVVNGGVANSVNYTASSLVLRDDSTTFSTESDVVLKSWDFRAIATAKGYPYGSAAHPEFHIRYDRWDLSESGAFPDVVPEQTYTTDLTPKTWPDTQGRYTANWQSGGGSPMIGLMPGWSYRALVAQGTANGPALEQEDRVHALIIGTCGNSGPWDSSGEVIVLTDQAYSGMGPARSGHSWNSSGPTQITGGSASPWNNTRTEAGNPSHQPGGPVLQGYLSGRPIFQDLCMGLEAGGLMVQNGKLAPEEGSQFSRNPTVGSTTYYGAIHYNQVRSSGWQARTLSAVAHMLPDAHPANPYYTDRLTATADFWTAAWADAPTEHKAHGYFGGWFLSDGFITSESGKDVLISPWMMGYWTQAASQMVLRDQMPVTNAFFLEGPVKFWRDTIPVYCGGLYRLTLKDPTASSPYPVFVSRDDMRFDNNNNCDTAGVWNWTESQRLTEWPGSGSRIHPNTAATGTYTEGSHHANTHTTYALLSRVYALTGNSNLSFAPGHFLHYNQAEIDDAPDWDTINNQFHWRADRWADPLWLVRAALAGKAVGEWADLPGPTFETTRMTRAEHDYWVDLGHGGFFIGASVISSRGAIRWNGYAWTGAPEYLLLFFGGGHTDYAGTEVYAYDVRTGRFWRMIDSGPYPAGAGYEETKSAGGPRATYGPNSPHCYSGILWDPNERAMVSTSQMGAGSGGPPTYTSHNSAAMFYPARHRWERLGPWKQDDPNAPAVAQPRSAWWNGFTWSHQVGDSNKIYQLDRNTTTLEGITLAAGLNLSNPGSAVIVEDAGVPWFYTTQASKDGTPFIRRARLTSPYTVETAATVYPAGWGDTTRGQQCALIYDSTNDRLLVDGAEGGLWYRARTADHMAAWTQITPTGAVPTQFYAVDPRLFTGHFIPELGAILHAGSDHDRGILAVKVT